MNNDESAPNVRPNAEERELVPIPISRAPPVMKTWLVCLLLSSAAASGAAVGSGSRERPDLTGRVLAQDGSPLPDAAIFVYRPAPRWAGARSDRRAMRIAARAPGDAQGKFEIESPDATLLFRLLVAAPGYRPRFVAKVDPATGPVTVKLERQALAKLGPKNKLTGEVVIRKVSPSARRGSILRTSATRVAAVVVARSRASIP